MHGRLEWNNGPLAQALGINTTHWGANPVEGNLRGAWKLCRSEKMAFLCNSQTQSDDPSWWSGWCGRWEKTSHQPPLKCQRLTYPSTPADRGRASKEGGCGFVLGFLYVGIVLCSTLGLYRPGRRCPKFHMWVSWQSHLPKRMSRVCRLSWSLWATNNGSPTVLCRGIAEI